MNIKQTPNTVENEAFILEGRIAAPEIFVDGWSQVLVGYPLTKVVFHTLVQPSGPDTKEIRKVAMTMTIPLAQAIQFAQTILSYCKNGEQQLAGTAMQQAIQVRDGLKLINEIAPPANVEKQQVS